MKNTYAQDNVGEMIGIFENNYFCIEWMDRSLNI